MKLPERQGKRLDYKWVIVIVSFLMVFTALGFCSSNKSLYLKSITSALDIPRGLFSISDSFRYITTTILNLFFGALILKMGARKLIAFGFLALILSCLIYSWGESIYAFYVAGCLLGMGLAWCTTTMVGYVVSSWFQKNRGSIMGVILAANGLGGAVSSQIVSPMIHDSTTIFGYRTAYRVTALILLVVAVIVMIFFKEKPAGESSAVAPVEKKKPSRSAVWVGIPFSSALRKHYFYGAAVCVFLTGFSLQAIVSVSSAHLEDVGFDATFVAGVLSFYSLLLTGSKILSGVSFDRLGLKITLLICDSCAVLAIFLLAIVTPGRSALVIIYEVLVAIAMPLETIMIPLIAQDMFGEHSYAKIMGLFVSICTAGFAVSSPLANLVFDVTGSYKGVLFSLSALMVVITVYFQFILHQAGKDRRVILTELATTQA